MDICDSPGMLKLWKILVILDCLWNIIRSGEKQTSVL